MIFQHANRKKLMEIHILQIEFHLLVDTVHARDSKNIVICAQVPFLHREIFMHVCVCTIPAFGSDRFPLSIHLEGEGMHICCNKRVKFNFEVENKNIQTTPTPFIVYDG